MKVQWTKEALLDRIAIWEYLSERNPTAAIDLDELFSESVVRLVKYPMIGVKGKIEGTRELIPHEHYRMVYQIDNKAGIIWIVTIVHTARRWPFLHLG
ncbi:type II toxin-antitoxin system RelE/ParE family toxin [Leminorella richardii]|uniref:type II toxin-antitoxin system RelE/ParE family toxin n=1 Tax=Leminorella richardii TaxID=158841 RepID=UPI000DBE319B|nr:type II toxin-antitoxin system RelE/ParE family toxin [Leminorella richardii]